jgi:crossover junction endodeoxyribonuclease RuvC
VEGGPTRVTAVSWGVIRTKPATPHAERLRAIHDGVAELLAEHSVEGAAIEDWFIHAFSRSAMGMAEARGAVQVAIAGAGVAVTQYSPNTIKQSVTGNGSADKQQVRAMITRLTRIEPGSDHAADALAAAICHLCGAPLTQAIRRAR